MFTQVSFASVSLGTITPGFQNTKVCHEVSCASHGTINFKPTGVTAITIDDTTGISGTAWGNELGWINFKPINAGVTINPSTGLLSGKAWSQVSGWINFSVTGQSVVINNNGEFFGWAWTGGEQGGWIKFDCSDTSTCVKTDWRPIPARIACSDGIDNDNDGKVDYPIDPGCTSPSDTDETDTPSGGSGGGGGGGSGTGVLNPNPNPSQVILPSKETTMCDPYIISFIKLGNANNIDQVKKLETFLNEYQGEKLEINGVYETVDFEAVKRFQKKYSKEILGPWKTARPTGYVYMTTLQMINKIYCSKNKLPEKPIKDICPYFTQYHKPGEQGGDITKIQKFINTTLGESTLSITGVYDEKTTQAVKQFQKKYSKNILLHWGLTKPTGLWYKTTRKLANEFMNCSEGTVYLEGVNKKVL